MKKLGFWSGCVGVISSGNYHIGLLEHLLSSLTSFVVSAWPSSHHSPPTSRQGHLQGQCLPSQSSCECFALYWGNIFVLKAFQFIEDSLLMCDIYFYLYILKLFYQYMLEGRLETGCWCWLSGDLQLVVVTPLVLHQSMTTSPGDNITMSFFMSNARRNPKEEARYRKEVTPG